MTASYFTRRKGLEDLVRALARIVKSRPEVRLRACGKGPMVPEAERLAEQLGVRDNLTLEGFVPMADLAQHYSSARVYVQPSLSETLPSAVLQALACGTPVVATRVGLLEEFLGGSEAVTLVPPRDPEALAEAVLRALDATPRVSMAARHHVERSHAWPVIAERWKRAYDAALVGG
jgi:glycosyltransferase involved in cell wall biosynthesis